MFFSFQDFCNRVSMLASKKFDSILYGNCYGTIIKTIGIYFLVLLFASSISSIAFSIAFLLGFFYLLFYFSSLKVAFACSETECFYVSFLPFYKVRKSYLFSFSSVEYLSLFRLGPLRFCKISFLSREGSFVRLRFFYSSLLFGRRCGEQKNNVPFIDMQLRKVEKKLERGDF